MTIDQIKAELRRSACEDAGPFSNSPSEAFKHVWDYMSNGERVPFLNTKFRTFFLLVAEAIE